MYFVQSKGCPFLTLFCNVPETSHWSEHWSPLPGESHSVSGTQLTYRLAADVGLLSRNIKIIGHHHPELFEESFGARVLVANYLFYKGRGTNSDISMSVDTLSNIGIYSCLSDAFIQSNLKYSGCVHILYIQYGPCRTMKQLSRLQWFCSVLQQHCCSGCLPG